MIKLICIQFCFNNTKNLLELQKLPHEVIFVAAAAPAAVVVFVDTVLAVAQKVEYSGHMDYCCHHLLKIIINSYKSTHRSNLK